MLRGSLAGACAAIAMTGAAQAGLYATIDIPGAGTANGQGTFPTSIGGGSVVVGSYTTATTSAMRRRSGG
jgi:hypothetical protein